MVCYNTRTLDNVWWLVNFCLMRVWFARTSIAFCFVLFKLRMLNKDISINLVILKNKIISVVKKPYLCTRQNWKCLRQGNDSFCDLLSDVLSIVRWLLTWPKNPSAVSWDGLVNLNWLIAEINAIYIYIHNYVCVCACMHIWFWLHALLNL